MRQSRFLSTTSNGSEWLSRRNCALAPAQLAACFGALALVSLGVATAWAAAGAWVVVPFACIEVGALAVAFVAYGRHAVDFERIVVDADRVRVESTHGPRTRRWEGERRRVRVEYGGGRREMVRLVARDETIEVGRFVLEQDRPGLAKELRAALGAP
jgi:uncharacterized membrane protein